MEEIRDLVLRAAAAVSPDERAEAFGRLVDRFQDMACAYAYSILGDFHLAEDAAQEAFLTAFGQLHRLRRPEAFPGWFRRIVWSACGRFTRDKAPVPPPLEVAGQVPAVSAGPAEAAEKSEARQGVLDAVGQLPPPQREVTTLFYINGYSQQDIAEFLEVPVTTVKNRLHAAKRRLRERMLNMVAEELHRSKPSPDFADRVRQIISLRKQGSNDEALRMQESVLGMLGALQREGRYEDVVRGHQAAMRVIRDDGSDPRMWCQTYEHLSTSYIKVGKARELADELLAAVPAAPTPQEVGLWVGRAMLDLMGALRAAGDPDAVAEQGRRLLGMLREAVAAITLEPWQGPSALATAAPVTKAGEILRTGRMNEYLAEAEGLLRDGKAEEFRGHVLTVLFLPEVLLLGLPDTLETYEIPGAIQRRLHASRCLAVQGRYDFCEKLVQESLAIIERLRGQANYRFLRTQAFLDQLSVAVARKDAPRVEALRRQVHGELEGGEKDLAAACPDVRGEADAENDDERHWCERLAAAYMIAISSLGYHKLIDAREALRMTRREARLHHEWITEELLARWTLAATGDRVAALEHFRKARTGDTDLKYLQNVLQYAEEYVSVREDPDFQAVVKE